MIEKKVEKKTKEGNFYGKSFVYSDQRIQIDDFRK